MEAPTPTAIRGDVYNSLAINRPGVRGIDNINVVLANRRSLATREHLRIRLPGCTTIRAQVKGKTAILQRWHDNILTKDDRRGCATHHWKGSDGERQVL